MMNSPLIQCEVEGENIYKYASWQGMYEMKNFGKTWDDFYLFSNVLEEWTEKELMFMGKKLAWRRKSFLSAGTREKWDGRLRV